MFNTGPYPRTFQKPQAPPGDEVLVFDGTMDFRPNVDAVLWFASEVWPLIRKAHPDARFFIVGRNPTPDVLALARMSGITVTGAVDDPRSWVSRAGVYVVPMRMGGGVRLKVLQAMSMERAIVSTPMGAEGIDVEPGKQMLIARSPQAFADATLSLLGNPARRASLGKAARELVSTHYAWPILLPTLGYHLSGVKRDHVIRDEREPRSYLSRITYHSSRLTPHASLLTPHFLISTPTGGSAPELRLPHRLSSQIANCLPGHR